VIETDTSSFTRTPAGREGTLGIIRVDGGSKL
jgi:hypothetical protein